MESTDRAPIDAPLRAEIAARLDHLLKEAGISRAEAAKRLMARKVEPKSSTINEMFNGKVPLHFEVVTCLAEMLGVSLEHLARGREGPMRSDLTPEELQVLHAYRVAAADLGLTADRAARRLTSPPVQPGKPPE